MTELKKGNILKQEAVALVNTVNCVGVMGRGVALQFKEEFPENYKRYKIACDKGLVKPGHMFVFETGMLLGPKFIINFPTKRHWREKSRIEDIESGLVDFINVLKERNINSVAVPPLGCGLGGLKWSIVKPMIEKALAYLPNIHVYLFEPVSDVPAITHIATNKPK
jgi:O-acetyl-ADP-ribose deacetylase (regulator of RNase III)